MKHPETSLNHTITITITESTFAVNVKDREVKLKEESKVLEGVDRAAQPLKVYSTGETYTLWCIAMKNGYL